MLLASLFISTLKLILFLIPSQGAGESEHALPKQLFNSSTNTAHENRVIIAFPVCMYELFCIYEFLSFFLPYYGPRCSRSS